jgi:hypothetical protein
MSDQERRVEVVARKVRHIKLVTIQTVMLVVVILALVVIGFAAWRINLATECMVEQFAEHRTRNESAHQHIAEKIGATYEPETGDLPESNPDLLRRACRGFRGHD